MQLTYSASEAEIIEGCIKEKRQFQKMLYERYYSKMMGVCMRYANGKEQATEILNIGFMKVFQSIASYASKGGNLESWIYRIMVNAAIDFLRAEVRHRHAEMDATIYVEDNSNVIADLNAEQILELVNQLTPGYRTVFNLYVIEGYTHPEIAGLLGINEGTSKSNLAKARAKLQDMILKLNEVNIAAYGK